MLGLRKMRKRDLRASADEELMILIAKKDADAFEVFYDRHAGAAYSLAYRMIGDEGQAEDATQDALLSIWRRGAAYDRSRGSVRTWALGITRNRAIDLLRAGSVATRKLANDDELVIENEPSAEETEAEALRRETTDELIAALKELPDEQSQVIALSYYGGFSQTQIAEMLGEPLGTIKGRMRLGLEKIRLALAEGIV